MDNKDLIKELQYLVTALSQQSDGHLIESRIFASQGLSKLAEKYEEHAIEERGWVKQCIDRILDLGGEPKLEQKGAGPIYTDPVEWIKYDLEVSKNGLSWLKGLVNRAKDDFTTFDILKNYFKDEEEDAYWGEQQLELIDRIGIQNWLTQQL